MKLLCAVVWTAAGSRHQGRRQPGHRGHSPRCGEDPRPVRRSDAGEALAHRRGEEPQQMQPRLPCAPTVLRSWFRLRHAGRAALSERACGPWTVLPRCVHPRILVRACANQPRAQRLRYSAYDHRVSNKKQPLPTGSDHFFANFAAARARRAPISAPASAERDAPPRRYRPRAGGSDGCRRPARRYARPTQRGARRRRSG